MIISFRKQREAGLCNHSSQVNVETESGQGEWCLGQQIAVQNKITTQVPIAKASLYLCIRAPKIKDCFDTDHKTSNLQRLQHEV